MFATKHRGDFQTIARLRLAEARVLLDAGLYSGAYDLSGYAVECGLKACLAKQFRPHDIPDRNLVQRIWTHDLIALVGLAGLTNDLDSTARTDAVFKASWGVVKDWTVDSRYEQQPELAARSMYAAVSRSHGVMRWIIRRW